MSERQQAKRILSLEIFDDNIIVIQYGDEKMTRKINTPLVLLPILFSLLVVIIGSEEVKKIETWLDRVWIKRLPKKT